jgi:hypothetical protein
MKDGECQNCKGEIEAKRAAHTQTKYCARCAREKKRENTLPSRHPEDQRVYMRDYMRDYRGEHPGLSTPYVQKHRERKRAERGASNYALLFLLLPLLLMVGLLPNWSSLSFESVSKAITDTEQLVLKAACLASVAIFCYRYLASHLGRDGDKRDEDK